MSLDELREQSKKLLSQLQRKNVVNSIVRNTNNNNANINNNNASAFLDDEVKCQFTENPVQIDTSDEAVKRLYLDDNIVITKSDKVPSARKSLSSLSVHSDEIEKHLSDSVTSAPLDQTGPTQPAAQLSPGRSYQPPAGGSYIQTVPVTPNVSSAHPYSNTPKSILKHRRMIDGNIDVKSHFQHTPGWMDKARFAGSSQSHLNHSYDIDSDDEYLSMRLSKLSPKKKAIHKNVKSRLAPSAARKLVSFVGHEERSDRPQLPSVDEMIPAAGNVRPLPSVQPTLPQSTNLTLSNSPVKAGGEHEYADITLSPSKYKLSPEKEAAAAESQRMLGYDWIAGLLESDGAFSNKSEEYFDHIREFRRDHKDECSTHLKGLPDSPVGDSALPEVANYPSPEHTCIHNYIVNKRLFAVPTNPDSKGKSKCPVCQRKQRDPTTASPGFVRVSIPRSTLSSPHKVKPHRRKSFDPSDSYALSRHCLAGWESQRPVGLPRAHHIDLSSETNKLKSKWTMTMEEAQQLAHTLKKGPVKSRDLETTTLYSRELRKVTDNLLSLSSALDYQSQILKKTTVL